MTTGSRYRSLAGFELGGVRLPYLGLRLPQRAPVASDDLLCDVSLHTTGDGRGVFSGFVFASAPWDVGPCCSLVPSNFKTHELDSNTFLVCRLGTKQNCKRSPCCQCETPRALIARARAVAPGQAFSVREFRGGRRRRSSREFVTQEGDIEVMFHVEGGVHDLSYACHLMRPGDTRERAGVRV